MYFGYFAEQLSLLDMNRLAVEIRHFLCLCRCFKDYYTYKAWQKKMGVLVEMRQSKSAAAPGGWNRVN